MPDWDDEYFLPYLSTGHVGQLDREAKGPPKKVNTGFQIPGNEYPKPEPAKKKPRKTTSSARKSGTRARQPAKKPRSPR